MKIPNPVIAEVSDALAWKHSHSELNIVFQRSGAPGDTPTGNKIDKCVQWLSRANADDSINAFDVLGVVLEDFIEREPFSELAPAPLLERRGRVERSLARYGLSYQKGGRILGGSTATPSRSLQTIIRERDLGGLDTEFRRALDSVEADPPAAVTAACAILEALFKVYIQDNELALPSDQSIKPLWKIVQGHLGLATNSVVDQDMNRILGGLTSIVDGVGALRTHAGSAHGRGRHSYPVTGKHARLAVHSSHTVATFVLETWVQGNGSTGSA